MKKQLGDIIDDLHGHLEYQKMMGVKDVPKSPPPRPSPLEGEVEGGEATGIQLDAIRSEIGDCKRCKLCKERKNIVFGVGNPAAQLMFVGEGPGADEDEQGIPFVGRAGQLLTKIIQAMGLKRDDVYIGNCVKCLKYNAMVQLGNEKWERIGRLVRSRYNGMVRSVDSDGKVVNKNVIGWHASDLGNRPVYKLTFKSAKNTGLFKCAIYLTGDHPVLTKRGFIEVQKLRKNDYIATGQGISDVAKTALYGMLLGDGHITCNHSRLSFSHAISQEDYAKFKMDILKNDFEFKAAYCLVSAGHEKKYPIIKCHTHCHRSLKTMRQLFYSTDKKKIVPKELRINLHPLTLALWFMDDGYLRIRPPRQASAEIATCAFSAGDLKILVNGLKRLGIKAHVLRNRIHFDVKATVKLSEIIAPYVPPSMRWKLHPKVERIIPFNKKLFKSNGQETLYDKVEKRLIKHRGTDRTFFCIDVEDTHNFVTTGGVVHNCRPPNNRNPEPDEIEACMPFLLKQITAIKPKIVVALGAIAAKMLLNVEIPISKIRGKVIDWEPKNINWPCKLIPTYHPAFLLRNPNMKRPVWEDMQVVMKLLAMG